MLTVPATTVLCVLETIAIAFRRDEVNAEYEGPQLEKIIFVYSCAE
jgi:hypothetical protein